MSPFSQAVSKPITKHLALWFWISLTASTIYGPGTGIIALASPFKNCLTKSMASPQIKEPLKYEDCFPNEIILIKNSSFNLSVFSRFHSKFSVFIKSGKSFIVSLSFEMILSIILSRI